MYTYPKVSIRIPVYNGGKTIAATIKSLVNQTYENFDLTVFDNNSTDNTTDIIDQFRDDRIFLVRGAEHIEWSANFSRSIAPPGGEIMLVAHADDLYHPTFLETMVDGLLHSGVDLIFCGATAFSSDEEGQRAWQSDYSLSEHITIFKSRAALLRQIILNGNFLYSPSAVGFSECFQRGITYFDSATFGGSADLDAWLRASKEYSVGHLSINSLFRYRISKHQISYYDAMKSQSEFVKCCHHHLSSEPNLLTSERKALEKSLHWHRAFYLILKLVCSGERQLAGLFLPLLRATISSMSPAKKFKLIVLATIYLCLQCLPKKLRLRACQKLCSTLRD